jgi:hypothetical protein
MQQATFGDFTTDGFDMEQYEAELDSIVADVIPSKTDPLV